MSAFFLPPPRGWRARTILAQVAEGHVEFHHRCAGQLCAARRDNRGGLKSYQALCAKIFFRETVAIDPIPLAVARLRRLSQMDETELRVRIVRAIDVLRKSALPTLTGGFEDMAQRLEYFAAICPGVSSLPILRRWR